MTATRRDDLRWRIGTIVRDTSWATLSVIQDYMDDVYKNICENVTFPQHLYQEIMTAGGSSSVEFSALSIDTYDIITIRDTTNNLQVALANQAMINATVPNQSQSTGSPQVWWPKDDHSAYVWPYGTSTTWAIDFYKAPAELSADSRTINLPDLGTQVLIDGVVARIFDWKDDNRAMKYDMRYQKGLKDLKASVDNPFGNTVMRTPYVGNYGADWMLRD